MGTNGVRDLIVWQLADELRVEVFRLTTDGSASRDFRFRDQIRSAASGIATNIAEGYGRSSHADFARFIDYALSSMVETEDWTRDGELRGYWSGKDAQNLNLLFRRLTPALTHFLRYLRTTSRP